MGCIADIGKNALCLGALVVAASLAGCSGTDVQIESSLLNSLGITGSSHKEEAKLVDRPPLVPPPTKKLPLPGSVESAGTASNWPVDPGDQAKQLAALKAKKQKEYEENGDWSKNRDPDEFDKLLHAQERRPGIFGNWSAGIGRETSETPPSGN